MMKAFGKGMEFLLTEDEEMTDGRHLAPPGCALEPNTIQIKREETM